MSGVRWSTRLRPLKGLTRVSTFSSETADTSNSGAGDSCLQLNNLAHGFSHGNSNRQDRRLRPPVPLSASPGRAMRKEEPGRGISMPPLRFPRLKPWGWSFYIFYPSAAAPKACQEGLSPSGASKSGFSTISFRNSATRSRQEGLFAFFLHFGSGA